jgi:O-6-methylguanine DNA methyltransferase
MRTRIATPWSYDLCLATDGEAIVESRFVRKTQRAAEKAGDSLLREAAAQVRAYFAGRLQRFDLPLHMEGTPFQLAVWQAVAALSFGQFVSYADVARAIGRPLAHRGVAMAMSRTPLDLVIPAHRVLGADGRVKGAQPGSLRLRLVRLEQTRGGLAARRAKDVFA